MLNPKGEVKPEVIAQSEQRCLVCTQRPLKDYMLRMMMEFKFVFRCSCCGAKHKIVEGRVQVIGVSI